MSDIGATYRDTENPPQHINQCNNVSRICSCLNLIQMFLILQMYFAIFLYWLLKYFCHISYINQHVNRTEKFLQTAKSRLMHIKTTSDHARKQNTQHHCTQMIWWGKDTHAAHRKRFDRNLSGYGIFIGSWFTWNMLYIFSQPLAGNKPK